MSTTKTEENRGGAREGAGRPRSKVKHEYVTVRHEKKIIDKLRKKYERGELAEKLRDKMTELYNEA